MLFAHRLALAMGRVDVEAMLHEITLPQMTRWMAYYQIEPFGDWAQWQQHGALLSMIANIMRAKGDKAYKASDFIPE